MAEGVYKARAPHAMTAFEMYCDNTNVLTESLFMFLNSLPPGAYLEETLDQPLDLSIKRASNYHDSDSNSNSSNSSDSSYGNDDRTDEDAEKIEDLHLYNLLRENSSINEMHLKNRNTPVLWQFLLMCLSNNQCNPSLIEWISKENVTFKLTNVNALANLWGQIKKRPRMNADHFKRSLRSYYSRNILRRIEGYPDTYQFIIGHLLLRDMKLLLYSFCIHFSSFFTPTFVIFSYFDKI
ncbi:Ecdysone-induced protein 74EF isoform A [Echinococcus granulosus]|uniref:ETS transcription factor Elf 1 n=1 Tax=Echinococcus granulosus TaxID=6210 RepID=A0A068WAB3_ECHGR|nr:Ecdysone-induced protein 74EF isoform A [Echinococcus granulosus]CDS15304.1 ETS transcription factor Elf 1 [Echinococcus granulosus]